MSNPKNPQPHSPQPTDLQCHNPIKVLERAATFRHTHFLLWILSYKLGLSQADIAFNLQVSRQRICHLMNNPSSLSAAMRVRCIYLIMASIPELLKLAKSKELERHFQWKAADLKDSLLWYTLEDPQTFFLRGQINEIKVPLFDSGWIPTPNYVKPKAAPTSNTIHEPDPRDAELIPKPKPLVINRDWEDGPEFGDPDFVENEDLYVDAPKPTNTVPASATATAPQTNPPLDSIRRRSTVALHAQPVTTAPPNTSPNPQFVDPRTGLQSIRSVLNPEGADPQSLLRRTVKLDFGNVHDENTPDDPSSDD